MTELHISWMTVLWLLVLALVVLLSLRALRTAIAVLPMSAARRNTAERAVPILELSVGVLYLVTVIRTLFSTQPQVAALGVLGVVLGGLWLARTTLVDFLAGVRLRSGGNIRLGDRVHLDDLEGTVTRLGYTDLAVQTRAGDEALIPYSRLAVQSVVRTPLIDGAYRHTFRLAPGAGGSPAKGADRARRLALLCHWSSVARPPIVEVSEDGSLAVTVFALDAERGPDIEAFVKSGLVEAPTQRAG